MTHSVHTAHDIMLQDTEGEHHGETQLVLSSMPQTGMQTFEIAQEELPDCYITARKSPNLHIVQSKQNEPSLLPLCNWSADVLSQRAHNPLNFCCVILCHYKQEIVQEGFQLSRQDIMLPNEVIGWEPWQVSGLLKGFGNYVSQVQSNILHHVS